MKRTDRPAGFRAWVTLALGLIAVLALAILTIPPALPHEASTGQEYDGWCCNGSSEHGDCQAISAELVKPVEGGWRVTLRPGDHRLVTEPHTYFMPQKKTRASQDGEYHACLFPTEDTLRCLYAPPMGF